MSELKHPRARDLQDFKSAFQYVAAGCFGGMAVAVALVGEEARLPMVLLLLGFACLGWAYRLGFRIKWIEKAYANSMSANPDERISGEEYLKYCANEPLWRMMLPWN